MEVGVGTGFLCICFDVMLRKQSIHYCVSIEDDSSAFAGTTIGILVNHKETLRLWTQGVQIFGIRILILFSISIFGFSIYLVVGIWSLVFSLKRGDKSPLTELNHMSYNNLTVCARYEKRSVMFWPPGSIWETWSLPCVMATPNRTVNVRQNRS